MQKCCRSYHLPICLSVLTAAVLLFAAVMLAGCGAEKDAQPAEIPFYPVVVYDDGVYAVECTDLSFEIGTENTERTALRLRVTNNSTDSTALSSVLGIRVTADGNPCGLFACGGDKTPLDGLINSGCSREGWIITETPVGASGFTVDIAVNYLEDQWISFIVSR